MTLNVRTVLYCLLGGLSLTIAAAGAGHFGLWWLSGVVLSAAFVPVARFGPRGWLAQFGVILPALFVVGSLCTESEVVIFFPGLRVAVGRDLAGGFVILLTQNAGLGITAVLLLRPARRSSIASEMATAG